MKLKQDIDFIRFFETVNTCQGEVIFQTSQDNRLNLCSNLSRYVFATLTDMSDFLKNGVIHCDRKEDYERLASFLSE